MRRETSVTSNRRPPKLTSAWREAQDLIRQHRGRLLLGLVLLLVNRAAGLVLPGLSKVLIDEVVALRKAELLWPLALTAAAATVVQGGTSFALSQILGVAAQRVINDLRKAVQSHVLRLPIRYFDSTQTGVLLSRVMSDAEGVRNLVGNGLVQLVGGLLTATAALGVLFWLQAEMTAVILVVLAIFGGLMAVAFARLRPLFRQRGKIHGEVSGRLTESLGGVRVVKAYTAEAREEAVFRAGVDRLFDNVRKSITGVSAVTAGTTVIVGAIGALLILLGGRSILDGTMTVGDLVMYLVFTGLVAAPMVQIASIGTQITEAFAGMDRIREIRGQATEDAGDAEKEPCPNVRGEVAFEQVEFAYEVGRPVLRGVTFRAPAGSTTALVGSSGSGKSTLVHLAMAFHRPTAGRITVDGRDLAGLRLSDYRSHLGVVLQDNFLFDGTVAENIRFARPDATDDEVREAGRIAHCDEFVRGFPQDYETVVGERGIRLSGGQRQRIAIARALLARPRILILDEATSSLDSESEGYIQDGLRALRRERTTFVIAHRLSTIRSADLILVLEAGEIVERGTHAELHAAQGRYRDLHDRQYRLESDRYMNPGEDFSPEPAPLAPPPARREM